MGMISKSSFRRAADEHKTYGMDLDVVIDILCLNSQQQRPEPFKRPEISADPEEVYLP
jgi:hypothetical protein